MITLFFVEQWQRCRCAPVSLDNRIFLAIMISSTELVIPASPHRFAFSSSLTTPEPTRFLSSQCDSTGMLQSLATSMASLARSEFMTDLPSSLIAGLPASTISLMSANSSPCCPFVTAPTCNTCTSPTLSAL